MEIVIITGMSGAGKTTALHILEDLGYYCTDNIPPQLMPELALAIGDSKSFNHDKVAMVADIRMGQFFSGIYSAIEKMKETGADCKLLFLDASDESIVNRYNFTKRKHPMSEGASLKKGIERERDMMSKIKDMSTYILDTTGLEEKQFKVKLREVFTGADGSYGIVHIISFGFKRGAPTDVDMMFDMRYLPNPFYEETLRECTGLEQQVRDYIFRDPDDIQKVRLLVQYVKSILKDYFVNAKESLSIGVGCTGGKHRSVASAEMICKELKSAGIRATVEHRDINL